MKTFRTSITTFGLATAFALTPFAAQLRAQDASDQLAQTAPDQGDSSVSFQTFYDQLADQGTWIQSDQYGYVFQPNENDPNWRPYTYGHWVNTDAGMTWVSDDSFGWATDHYGRWVNLYGTGWVWVPGYTWAPAWVSWRDGGDEVGWAPLPPDSDIGIDYYGANDIGLNFGFHIGSDCDTAYGIGAGYYNFCPIAYIGDRDCYRHFRDHRDNFAFIGQTRNVTNINFRRGQGFGRFDHVRAEGPNVARLNEHAHNRIQNAQLTGVSRRDQAGLRGNNLAVYAPRVDRNTVRSTRPNQVAQTLNGSRVNRGTNINDPLAVNQRVRPEAANAEQIRAARTAQSHEPSSARVATADTRIAHPLTQPLTSFRTDTRTARSGVNNQRFDNNGTQTPRVTNRQVTPASGFTGQPATTHTSVAPAGDSRFTGEPVNRHNAASGEARNTGGGFRQQGVASSVAPQVTPQVSQPTRSFAPAADPRFTGEPVNRHNAASGESRYTGGGFHQQGVTSSAAPQSVAPQATQSTQNRAFTHHEPAPSVNQNYRPASVYQPQANTQVFRSNAQTFHPQANTVNPNAQTYRPQASAPVFHNSAPAFHQQSSAPAYHPQASAPAFHPAPAFHASAPAPQSHGNGGGGGHPAAAATTPGVPGAKH